MDDGGVMVSALDFDRLTWNQPFCAGVVIVRNGCILVTLNPDGIDPAFDDGSTLRIGGVGGGQEAGETAAECAAREAKEELGVAVRIQAPPCTFFHDLDTDILSEVQLSRPLGPVLLQRRRNACPTKPYRPGLPTGPYTYYCLFLADTPEDALSPGDDVVGLLWVHMDSWSDLEHGLTIEDTPTRGWELLALDGLPKTTRLWLPPHESLSTVIRLQVTRPTGQGVLF